MSISDPLSSILLQIEDLTSNLNKKNLKNVSAELQNLSQIWGRETELQSLRCLFSSIDISGDQRNPFKETVHSQLLKEIFSQGISKTGFASNFCAVFDSQIKRTKVNSASLVHFAKSLRISRILEVILGLILQQSAKTETRNAAFDFLKKKLPELLNGHANPDTSRESGIFDCSIEAIHFLLLSILKNPPVGVPQESIDKFVQSLRKDFPQIRVPVIIAPFLYNDTKNDCIIDVIDYNFTSADYKTTPISSVASMDSNSTSNITKAHSSSMVKSITGSLALQIQEIGYEFCQDLDTCRRHLSALGAQTLTAGNVAHILAMMVRTNSGLKDGTLLPDARVPWDDEKSTSNDELVGWKVDTFIQVVNNMVSNLNWTDVITELDQPGFALKDRQGLLLLTRALLLGLRDTPFPTNVLYTMWANKEGQLSWIQKILRYPDVFCLVDYSHRPVHTADIIKPPPEESKEISSWRSLDLVDLLLSLGEVPGLSTYVQECLRFPVDNCPELLALGLVQSTLPMSAFRQELLVGLFQLLLGGQSKESRLMVFSYALNGPVSCQHQLRQCVLHAMAQWYTRNVEIYDRLTKIFQIAIKLKILLDLLNLPQFQFTIDLACLASKCDYVNLNRWLTEKIQAHGEPFVQACIQFLKQRFSLAAAGDGSAADQARQAAIIPSLDVLPSVLMLLQSLTNHVPSALGQEITKLTQQYAALTSSTPAMVGSSAGAPPSTSMPSSVGAIGSGSAQSTNNAPSAATPNSAVIGGSLRPAAAPSAGGGVIGSSATGFTALNPVNFSKVDSAAAHANSGTAGSLFGGVGDISNPLMFGNPNFQNPGHGQTGAGSPSTISGLQHVMAGFAGADSLGSLLKPAATGWGAGFGVSSTASSGTAPMMPVHRPTGAPQQTLNATGLNEPNNPDITQTFAEDIQEEANGYFQQIYTQPPQPSMSIEQFLDVLKRFRDSTDKKQLDVFACMIKNLFEEFNFFEQYPEKELHTTALLFGGVIREGLVSGMPLMFALRVVLEALKKEQSAKLFSFGSVALDQFKGRLKDYPRYCSSLIGQFINKPQQLPAKLLEYVQHGCREEWPPGHQQPPPTLGRSVTPAASHAQAQAAAAAPPPAAPAQQFVAAAISTSGAKPAPTLNATNIDTLVHATAKEDSKVAVPTENIVEKVAFLFNNLSQMNMQQKVTEMKSMMKDEHLPWLAQYLVMKRVSAESNFHNLYSNFVTALGNKLLNALFLKETYRNIKILLRSDKAAANFSDRTLLKNLGHWLGMITLMINKPILHRDLDLKSLLLEAFWKGQQELLYVVPFLAKIVESCQKSKVFKPPNPWTQAILTVLAELHQQPDLKLNLKFEVEVLFRHLSVELSSLKITNVLKDPVVMERAMKEPQLSNPIRLEKPTMTNTLQPSPVPTLATVGNVVSSGAAIPTIDDHAAVPQTSVTPTPMVARFSYHDIYVNNYQGFQGLIPHITVNASLPIFQVNPPLKHLVKPAIEHAIHELMVPVADRAIKVAMTTTENVIKKDFALDPDETRLRLAAQNMARSLTAGMAMITCRDPLLHRIQGYLKQGFYSSIRGATTEQQRMIEEAMQAIADDNVDLAQCFIVKFAAERACVEIDKRLTAEFDARRQARHEGRPYLDAVAAKYQSERLPDQIRLKIGAPDQFQLSVYDEFGKNVPGFKPSPTTGSAGVATPSVDDLFASFQSGATTAPPQRQFWSSTGATTPMAGPPVGAGHDDEILLQQLLRDVDSRLQSVQPHIVQNSLPLQGLVALRDSLVALASQNSSSRDTPAAQALLQKLVEIVLEYFAPRLTSAVAPQSAASGEGSTAAPSSGAEWNATLSEAFLSAVKSLTFVFGGQWVQKQVTKTLIDCRQESRFNVDAIDLLIRHQLVNMITYDLQLATAMDNGLNYKAVDFAQHLVRRLFVEQRTLHALSETDLSNTIEMLTRIGNSRMGANETANFGRQSVMDDFAPMFRQNTSSLGSMLNAPGQSYGQNIAPSASSMLSQLGTSSSSNMAAAQAVAAQAAAAVAQQQHAASQLRSAHQLAPFAGPLESGVLFVREFSGNDPPGLQEKTEFLLREWVNMHHTPAAAKDPSKAFSVIVSQMHQHGILKSDDLIARFFRLCTEMCVDLCYRALSDTTSSPNVVRARCFHTLDAFVLLIALLVKHSGEGQHATKINLLNKVLGIIAGVLLQDHKVRREDFHQLPFHRMFITLFLELTAADPLLEPIHMEILTAFCHTLHVIQPRYNPAFTFAWLDIIGHRAFIGRVLVSNVNQKAWSMYAQLLTDHLRFLAPFLRNIEFQKPVALVYVGTLRILLVLLHDLPELLCDYHYALCDVIPPNCVQLRNLVLSAYPRNMRLPDPFMPNLKVDQLAEINTSPRISVNFAQAVQPAALKVDLDNYLKNRAPVSFLSELRSKLQISNEPGQKYNVALINAVVLYAGSQAIQAIQSKEQRPSISTIAHTAHMDIFQNLAVDLDTEGRYLFFNAIANQLRYPNSHTHYFSCTLLYLFAEANSEAIQEQITRILFERLVALRPHPWGLLITFIELIKNPYYKFWTHHFVRCAPEIENLFDSIARSCMVKHVSETS